MTAAAAGVAMALGGLFVLVWWWARRPTLARRLGPHLRGFAPAADNADLAPDTPFPAAERLIGPVLRDGARAVARWGTSATELQARLRRGGSSLSVEQFRAQQVVWALAALAGSLLLGLVLAATRGTSVVALAVLVAAATVGGAVGREYALTRAIAKREARLVSELPTVAEMLALSVSAGEGALAALERVGRISRGAMSDEIRVLLGEVHAGATVSAALHEWARATGVAPLARFADATATAIERGTPLAQVLHAQAGDVRDAGRRQLMEEGGRREVAMMVPVVFLILPVTVVFAVFPGIVAINLGL